MASKEQVIKTAVEWWAKKLEERAPHDNGDTSITSMFAMSFADMLMKPVTQEQIDIFKNTLTAKLTDQFDNPYSLFLSVDYHPCLELSEAAEAAGIPDANFPYKTHMHIDSKLNKISVSDGYAQPYVELQIEE